MADKARLLVWGAGIICVSVLWNQYVFQSGLQKDTLFIALVIFAIGVPLTFGALAGCFIRRHGPMRELLLLAGVGGACIALALYAQWVNDTRACMPTPDSACDISLGFGAALSFFVCYVPFLLGAFAGRAASVLFRRNKTSLP
jgi:hypothetical protein